MNRVMFYLSIIILISLSIGPKVIDLIPTSIYNKRYLKKPSNDYFPKTPDELFMIEVDIGTPAQTFHLLVDTTAFPMWIQANDSISPIEVNQTTYNKSLSTTYKSSNSRLIFLYKDNTCDAKMITDQISIGSLKEFNFEFPLVIEYSSSLKKIDGIFGLSRGPVPNEKLKLTNSAIRSSQGYDQLEKNVFSLHFFDSYVPKLFIGREHSDFSRRDHIGSCDSIKMVNNYWGCQATQILFNDTSIPIGTEVVFDTSIEHIYFPAKLKNTFKSILSQKYCREVKEDDSTSYFNCNSLVDYAPFYLALGDTVMKLPKSMFIKKYESGRLFVVKVNFSSKYNDIRLGTSIFKYYHILFDERNQKIKFYVENEDNIGTLKDFKIIPKDLFLNDSNVFIMVILIGFIFTAIIAIKLIKNKKNKKRMNFEKYNDTKYELMKSLNGL